MDPETKDLIQKRFAELPPAVRSAITSADLRPKLQRIGQKYQLHIDQAGSLEDETTLVMMGFSDPAEFPDTLAKELGVSAEIAEQIAEDVSGEIFMPIRESMRAFTEQQAAQPVATPSQPAALSRPIAPQPAGIAPVVPALAKPVPSAPTAAPIPPVPVTPAAARPVQTVPTPPPAPVPKPAPELHPAAVPLSVPTSSVAKTLDIGAGAIPPSSAPAAAQEKKYPSDPYREPIE